MEELLAANERLRAELAERRLSELALRESENHFRNLADSVPVGIWVTGPDKRISFLSKAALSFVGRSMEELTGNGWIELVHSDDRSSLRSTFSSAVANRSPFRIECRMRRADGQFRWMLNGGIPRFVNSVYVGHIGTISDTTGLKRCHGQMSETQSIESLRTLAAGIAHNFNNLLGCIFAEADMALSEIPGGSPWTDNIQSIKAVAVRASDIVNLLLLYAGSEDAERREVDLSRIVSDMLPLLQRSISENATLQVRLAQDLPLLWANVDQIRLVVANLISNASEALPSRQAAIMAATERVFLSRPLEARNGELRAGEYVRLVVSDNGSGISEIAQSKVFDPFYTAKSLGRGMGLAVVDGIIRSHRGNISVLSKPGAGSTFEVLLPARRP